MIERCMRKPEYFDVLKFNEDDRESVFNFVGKKAEFIKPINTNVLALFVETFTGPRKVSHGYYIVKGGLDGQFSVFSPDEFESKFVKVKKTENK
jgi:hypothetical protein